MDLNVKDKVVNIIAIILGIVILVGSYTIIFNNPTFHSSAALAFRTLLFLLFATIGIKVITDTFKLHSYVAVGIAIIIASVAMSFHAANSISWIKTVGKYECLTSPFFTCNELYYYMQQLEVMKNLGLILVIPGSLLSYLGLRLSKRSSNNVYYF